MRLNEHEDSQAATNSAPTQGSGDSRARSRRSREEALQQGYCTLSEGWELWSAEPLVTAHHEQHFCCLHLCLHNIAYIIYAAGISMNVYKPPIGFFCLFNRSIYLRTSIGTHLPSDIPASVALSLSLLVLHGCMQCKATQRTGNVMSCNAMSGSG